MELRGVAQPLLSLSLSLSLSSLAEFSKIAFATGAGFLIMGFIGFFVKLMYVQSFFLLESFHCRNPPMLVRKGGFPGTFSENEHAAVFGLSVQQTAGESHSTAAGTGVLCMHV